MLENNLKYFGYLKSTFRISHRISFRISEDLFGFVMTLRLTCYVSLYLLLLGGYLAKSLAIMTDAAHMFTDFIGFVIGLFAIWLSHKPPTKYMNYGWHRAGK